MNDNLIERLRMFCCDWPYDDEEMTREAADRIEELEAKLAKAVEALKWYDDPSSQGDVARTTIVELNYE